MTYFMGDMEQNSPLSGPITAGPKTGFLQNAEAAYQEQAHVQSAFGADEDMATLEQQQLDKLYSLTGERLPPMFPGTYADSGPSKQERFAVMHSLAGDTLDANQQAYVADAGKQMGKYDQLAQQHGLLTYDQMFKQVQANAQQDIQKAAATNANATLMGKIGGFAGAAAGSMTYRDPINLATLALGGVGKSALMRVGTEMGFQGLAQAAQILTGGAENQELVTGKGPTTAQEVEQVAGGALGAGIIRGAGEAGAAGFRALVARFGAKAPDVMDAALAKEAQDAIGPSPYGNSRAAQGMHEADVQDALAKDVPLNLRQPPDMPATSSPFAAPLFATKDTDALFSGTSEPLSRVFDNLPSHASYITEAANKHASYITEAANKHVNMLTDMASTFDRQVDEIGEQIKAREGDLMPAKDLADKKAQLAALNNQIASESNLRKLGQLNKDKTALEGELGRAEAVNTDLEGLAQKRAQAAQNGNQVRIARAQLVEEAAKMLPGVKRSAVVKRMLGDDGESAARPLIDSKPNTMGQSEEIEKQLAAPANPEEAPEPKIIPAATPDENGVLPKGASDKDMVDLGQHSGPVDLDMPVIYAYDAEGNPLEAPIREVLQDHADDADLVKAMNECLI